MVSRCGLERMRQRAGSPPRPRYGCVECLVHDGRLAARRARDAGHEAQRGDETEKEQAPPPAVPHSATSRRPRRSGFGSWPLIVATLSSTAS
jgi:hypothetical protein